MSDDSIELFQEAQIVFEIETEVADLVFEHSHALDAHTEGETGVLVAIYPTCLQDIGVDHTAAKDFEPAGAFADVAALAAADIARDIHLGRRFGKGEVGGAKANLGLFAEHFFGEIEEGLFEVGESHLLVHIEGFDLMENAMGASRDGLVAEDPTRGDDADGGLVVLHDTDLDGRGMGAQSDGLFAILFLDEESILHIACGVVGREVEGREEVPVIFDFDRFGDGEADAGENLDNLIHHDGEDVAATDFGEIDGHGQVVDILKLRTLFNKRLKFLEFVLSGDFELVDQLSHHLFLIVRESLELIEEVADDPLFAQVLDTELFNFGSLIFKLFNISRLNVADVGFDLFFGHNC